MSDWHIELTKKAEKQFAKLDKKTQSEIVRYLERITGNGHPCRFGKALLDNLSGFWRYRVGKYRVICDIRENTLTIEIITIGKRDQVYR